ncbi:FxDxF family PEP-CTERM protein [Roseateles sp.]|jgi:hypothetical protein|uniref:FxDxF family PEP-CTERM protein n=1 Tax=Roseateles sp. TaxID=1971397 RepID=UPI0037C71AA3
MLKNLFSAALLALSLSAVSAGPIQFTGTLVSNGGGADLTAGLSSGTGSDEVTFFGSGAFEHRFKFSFAGNGLLNGLVMHIGDVSSWNTQGITFDDIYFLDTNQNKIDGSDLTGDPVDAGGSRITIKTSSFVNVTGDFYLLVMGVAGGEGVQGGSYSYSGLLNLTPTNDVPEPAGLALVLAALGGAVWVRRRTASPAAH